MAERTNAPRRPIEREQVETDALASIREKLQALADLDGAFVVRCGRTGERPVPVARLRFVDREVATTAVRLVCAYRCRLRFWDRRTRYVDPIVHEEHTTAVDHRACPADPFSRNRWPTG